MDRQAADARIAKLDSDYAKQIAEYARIEARWAKEDEEKKMGWKSEDEEWERKRAEKREAWRLENERVWKWAGTRWERRILLE